MKEAFTFWEVFFLIELGIGLVYLLFLLIFHIDLFKLLINLLTLIGNQL